MVEIDDENSYAVLNELWAIHFLGISILGLLSNRVGNPEKGVPFVFKVYNINKGIVDIFCSVEALLIDFRWMRNS